MSQYRADIDGLRAIAVLSVVVFHAFPGRLPGGFFGVDVFFVISGYLISQLILGDLARHSFAMAVFFQRRIIRIFPALIVVMLACLAFGWYILFADEYQQLGKHVTGGAGFVSNLLLLGESGYFDTSAETKPLLHLWSLGIEEQFYVVWPLLLVLVAPRRSWLLPVVLLAGLASFAINLHWLTVNPSAAYFLTVSRFWELMVGGLLAILVQRHGRIARSFENLQSIAGVILLAAAFMLIDKNRTPAAWWDVSVLPVLGAALILSAGPGAWINRMVLSNRALVWVGLISYPLYLWHWPLLTFARIVESSKPSIPIRLTVVAISIVLAWLTYRLVERPLRNSQQRVATTVALCVAMFVAGSAGYYTYSQGGLPSRSTIANYSWNGAVSEQFSGTMWPYTSNRSCLDRYPLEGADALGWWFCMLSKDQNPTLLLLGTSHANQLYPGLAGHPALSQQTVLSIGSCQPVTIGPADVTAEDPLNPCTGAGVLRQQRFIDDLIVRTPTIKHVVLDGLQIGPDSDYIDRLTSRVAFLEQAGAKVIVFTPHLRSGFDIRGCYSRPLRSASRRCELAASDRRDLDEQFKPLISSLSVSHPGVAFFDPNDLFCDDARCRFIANGLPLFRDEYDHMSEYASRLLAERFVTWARTSVPGLITPGR